MFAQIEANNKKWKSSGRSRGGGQGTSHLTLEHVLKQDPEVNEGAKTKKEDTINCKLLEIVEPSSRLGLVPP